MSLQILKASAGSGKTFSLTESFVRICLDPSTPMDFSNILAITFTNKASAEMKDRIIALLHQLSHHPESYPGIENLEQSLRMDRTLIRDKSSEILYRILCEFDHFNITTIDSFFTRLYGSMALDLFGETPKDITLEVRMALDEAADTLIENAKEREDLQGALFDLLDENIEQGSGINLKNKLTSLGQQLFRDDYLQLRETEHYIYPERDFHLGLTQKITLIQLELDEYQRKISKLLEEAGMEGKDFFNSFMNSILNKESPVDLMNLKSFARLPNPDQWFSKGKKDEMEVRVAPIRKRLQAVGEEFYMFCQREQENYCNYLAVLDNYGAYRILRYLDEALNQYFEENRLISLPSINLKIHQNIRDEDSMVVFEKIGQRLHSVMIDEFQDTAGIQWRNLEPFIRNSMSQGYPNLVVGDVKQAIYRFRDGNWEIMEAEVPELQKQLHPDGKPHVETLPYNWRSCPEIIDFNNRLFSSLASSVSGYLEQYLDDLIREYRWDEKGDQDFSDLKMLARAPETVYQDMEQLVSDPNKNKKGYVEVAYRYYEKDTEDEVIGEDRMQWLYETILEIYQEGFRGSDIGILSRGSKDMSLIADYLTRWAEDHPAFRFSSEDSLKLGLSDGVQLLISALKIKAQINRDINIIVFRDYYLKLHDRPWEEVFSDEKEDFIEKELDSQKGIEQLYLFFEEVIHNTDLGRSRGQYPYLLTFMEEVRKFELMNGPDVTKFLNEWEQRIQFQQIRMSDDEEKIRLYTIHKSKGLEFEVVLIPFPRWPFEVRAHDTIFWVSHPDDTLLRLAGPLPVKNKTRLLSSSFYRFYVSEYYRQVMDNMNLLYVALTRPRQRLYMWIHEEEPKSSRNRIVKPLRDTLDFFKLGLEGLQVDQKLTFGEKTAREDADRAGEGDTGLVLKNYPLRKKPLILRLKPSFDGSGDEAIEEGLLIHRLLENVEFLDSIPAAVLKSVQEGDIAENERQVWEHRLHEMLCFAPARAYFEQGWKVYNEKSIMITGGGEYRPDRIQENGKEYVVIDYKTGQKRKEHDNQIRNYREIISDMVDLPVRSFIFYPLLPEWKEVI